MPNESKIKNNCNIEKNFKILSKRQHTFVERFQILEKYFKISRPKKNFCV